MTDSTSLSPPGIYLYVSTYSIYIKKKDNFRWHDIFFPTEMQFIWWIVLGKAKSEKPPSYESSLSHFLVKRPSTGLEYLPKSNSTSDYVHNCIDSRSGLKSRALEECHSKPQIPYFLSSYLWKYLNQGSDSTNK